LNHQDLEINIEELVLHGFPPVDKYRIGQAVERELSRLFRDEGLPGSLSHEGSADKIDAGSFGILQGAKPEAIGSEVAKAVYRGLGR